MAKIRKIYDQAIKPDGSKLTIYPITSTRAVYTPESITIEALINEGYRFGGVIEHLEDSPEFTDQRVFYLADKVGVYPNFGNLTLAGGELGVFCYNKSQWIKGILKGGGTNLTGYQVVTSASLLPDEESTIGYIIGTNLYVWVGEDGDTKEGKYKNVGPFVGPQGNGIDQVFLSPTNYKLTIDFTDGTSWTSEQSIRGTAGAKGNKGDPGLTGATGATGPKGDKGNKGDSGVSLGDVVLTADLDETETGKALDASAMQTIPHYVSAESEIEDVPSNYYTRTQVDQKLLNNKAEVNQYLTNQDNDIARLEDRIDNMMDGVDEFIHHRPTVVNNGTIINAPDDEDLVATEQNTLKFADRPAINAMGYTILRKNKTFAEQVTKTNTIYEIRYDFDLTAPIVIPFGCVLKFVGGSVAGNYTITGQDTRIEAGLVQIFGADVTIAGTWDVSEAYPEWFGAIGVNGIDDSDALYCALNMSCNYVRFSKLYYISKPILLKSYVHIVGNYGMHTYKFGISVNQNFTSVVHNNQTIKSIFYLNSNASAPLIFEDVCFIGNYKANTLIHFQKDAPRFNIRLYRCNLLRFYQAAVFAAGNDACIINECLIQFCGVGVVGSDEQINFEEPLHYSGITGCGRSNHLIIHKTTFYACNVGVIIKYCSDCSLNDNLFAHASLCTMLLTETKAGIFGNYIENDWNCGFWITENGNDPNIEKESHSYFNPVLADKDVDIRAYIMLSNVQLELDSAFFSNYYIRCNSAVGGNAFNNKNVSGIDSLIYITNQCVIHIGNKRIRRQYNDASSVYIYDVISKDVQDAALSKISSTEIIKYRNLIENRSGKSYAPCLHSPILNSIEKKNKSIIFGENVLLQRPDGQPANFIGSYNLSEIIGNDYFYTRSNDLVTRNSLFISANDLRDIQYRAELKFHGSVAVDRISITAVYNSGDPVTKNYAVEGYGTGLRTLYLYFSKADFIESDRELLGIYVYDNGYISADSTGVVSSIMVFEEGCDSPVFISLPTHGTTRPLISDDVYYEFFDENSNVNKKIFHVGTAWVDATGTTVE